MVILAIILGVLIGLAIIIAVGVVCGRIAVDIIREIKSEQNEVLWFWLGFIFNITGVLMAILLKFAKNKE